MKPKLGQMIRQRPGWEIGLSPIACVSLAIEEMRAAPQPCRRCSSISTNRAKISIEEPGVARCRQVRENAMASVLQPNPYQCDQCGTANIVAAPVLYQQGTRTFSGIFNSGTSQSYSAQAVEPPCSRGYFRPFILWGSAIVIFFVWTIVGVSSIYEHPMRSALRPNTVAVFLFLGVASIVGLAYSLRRIAHYNREVYPRLRWNWEHTYICRRCGKFRLIPS
jgi:hypothetical protein